MIHTIYDKIKIWFRGKHILTPFVEFEIETVNNIGENKDTERFERPLLAKVLIIIWQFWIKRCPILLPIIVATIVTLFIHFDCLSILTPSPQVNPSMKKT